MKKNIFPKMVSTKSKHKVSCSASEQVPDSPSSDSLCDSDAASPVPFLCTQDGAEGDTDVVWNFYTPKSENAKIKNSTPISKKSRKPMKLRVIESPLPKRRVVRVTRKNTDIFQDLIELNQDLIAKKSDSTDQCHNEDDIFNKSTKSQDSPKSGLKSNSRCLRRNVLSSKFNKPDAEALESDDSINEHLVMVSQAVEEKIYDLEPIPAKRSRIEPSTPRSDPNFKIDTDNILNNISLSSPLGRKAKHLNNDSFDSLVGNLNDSALEKLTQMPIKDASNRSNSVITDIVLQHGSPSAKKFSRHKSMPESPDLNKPSTSGMVFGRYNSVPLKDTETKTGESSPIRCTAEVIRKKHRLAREKLLSKQRSLPFTSSPQTQTLPTTQNVHKKTFQPTAPRSTNVHGQQNIVNKNTSFQPRVPSSQNVIVRPSLQSSPQNHQSAPSSAMDLKHLIEKKRQEALMKLRRRQHHT